mmetsp:Transcript_18283/g.30040  ORF Transcript_18283/g.30040 Transcript_18283/m.30040 type:complete len:503 (-) Transcript_18283:162-1670(-)
MVKLNIKWNKQKFDNVEVDFAESPLVFKSQLWTLTGVPPERQKIMVKGGILKDDADWSKSGISEGQTLMMMGTADAIPERPVEKVQFVEDLAPAELQAVAMKGYPPGLVNLQNTCYLNATVQCLHRVPELMSSLKKYSNMSAAGGSDSFHNVTVALRDLFLELDSTPQPVIPFRFVQTFRNTFPQFSEQNPQGAYMQQDAEECWTQCLVSLAQKLKEPTTVSLPPPQASSSSSSASTRSVIDHLFGGELITTYKCLESEEEPVVTNIDKFQKLQVHPQDTKFLHEGIRKSLEEDVTKRSPLLERDAKFKKVSRIQKLPVYLVTQFVRFEWKPIEKKRAKILRDIGFPFTLDIFEFCTDDLKAKLTPYRDIIREKQEAEIRSKKAKLTEQAADASKPADPSTPAAVTPSSEAKPPTASGDSTPTSLEENQTGQYELIAVLTHMGRVADGGHYVAWVRQEKHDDWLKFDDDKVSPVREEDIKKLSGGYGDWHMAYMCLYRTKNS